MSRKSKATLLRKLTIAQLLVVLVGIVGMGASYFLVTRDTFRTALKNERAKVIISVDEQQSKWRTWKQLGLEEPLRQELASHAKVFALSTLDVVPASKLRFPLGIEEISIPEVREPADDTWVVYGRLNPEHIESAYVPYRSNLILLILAGLFFCFVILFSARYVRGHIYLPFLELRGVFEDCSAGNEVDLERIRARGEIRDFILSLVEIYKKLKENEKSAAMVTVARQVAHDIRSPLAALDMILDTLPQLPEQKRLIIRGALSRIRDIANNVLERSRRTLPAPTMETPVVGEGESPTAQSIASLVEELVNEKQILARERDGVEVSARVDDAAYALFAEVHPQPFKTVLSNLVNNAMEALDAKGTVRVALSPFGPGLLITITDNGKGIPAEILEKLRATGGSFGKTDGMGLGLSHARAAVEQWRGRLEIESAVGAGTKVKITLPVVAPPRWFVPAIDVEEGGTVLILDDDPSIHLVWQQRFNDAMKDAHAGVFLEHFSDTPSLRRWCTENQRLMGSLLFLCDYEIVGSSENGIDLIRSLALTERAILVTGRFDEPAVRTACEKNGIRLLPKGLGGCVPVRVRRARTVVDAVLVDDDPLVHMTWELAAKTSEKSFRGYYSVEEFLKASDTLDPSTPVFVDQNLGDAEKGDEAARHIVRAGFSEIYLATGEEPEQKVGPWIKGVRGKQPPWARGRQGVSHH